LNANYEFLDFWGLCIKYPNFQIPEERDGFLKAAVHSFLGVKNDLNIHI